VAWAAFSDAVHAWSAVRDHTASLAGYRALDLLPSCGPKETLIVLRRWVK
jgi:hypothetical protein